jgi:hypothetical protein
MPRIARHCRSGADLSREMVFRVQRFANGSLIGNTLMAIS